MPSDLPSLGRLESGTVEERRCAAQRPRAGDGSRMRDAERLSRWKTPSHTENESTAGFGITSGAVRPRMDEAEALERLGQSVIGAPGIDQRWACVLGEPAHGAVPLDSGKQQPVDGTTLPNETLIEGCVVGDDAGTVSENGHDLAVDERPLRCVGEHGLVDAVYPDRSRIDRPSRSYQALEEHAASRIEQGDFDHFVLMTDAGRLGIEKDNARIGDDPASPADDHAAPVHRSTPAHSSTNCSPGSRTMQRALVCCSTARLKACASCSISGNVL